MFPQIKYILLFSCFSPETHFKRVAIIYVNKDEGPLNRQALALQRLWQLFPSGLGVVFSVTFTRPCSTAQIRVAIGNRKNAIKCNKKIK